MEKRKQDSLVSEIVNFIGEQTRLNPGCSPGVLSAAIQKRFRISSDQAEKLAGLVKEKPEAGRLGLAAIELNLTFNCNLTCAYCFIREKNQHERMSFATAAKAVDLLMERAAFPTVNITLIGGEPLLEFELIRQIVPYAHEAARRRNIFVTWSVTTNGTLLNETILEYFAQNRINMLLSVDGGEKNHDRYRRTKSGEGTWQKIAGLIPLIKSYQPWLGVRMTVSTEAVGDMREDFKQLVELGVNQFIIAPAQGAECWSKEQIEQYGLNLVEILQDYHALKRRGIPIFIEEFEKDENEYKGWGCRAGSTSLALAPDGAVSPCSKMLGLTDEGGKYVIGNINGELDLKLLEPFQNPISRQPQHCRHCTRKCSGGCYAVNFEQTGDHFTASEENCLFWVVCQETKRISGMLSAGGAQCQSCRARCQ
ncbi:MAG: radical SAM protein [Peptococcaceae bacterium]|nr:radical SAM protein [Peptococcaceae bacterium]